MISRKAPKSTRYQFTAQRGLPIHHPRSRYSKSEIKPKPRAGQEGLTALSTIAQDLNSLFSVDKPRLNLTQKRRGSVVRHSRISQTRRRRSVVDKLSPYIEQSHDSARSSRRKGQHSNVEAIQRFFVQFHAKSKDLLSQLEQNVLGNVAN